MTAAATMTPEARERRRIRRPVLAVTAGAWLATIVIAVAAAGPTGHHPSGVAASAHTGHDVDVVVTGAATHAVHEWGLAFLGSWLLMLAAMMTPLLIPVLRHVHARSLPRRRARAVALVVAAYAAAWTAGGVVLTAVATALRAVAPVGGAAIVVGLVVAVAWQLSPAKQRCLNRCHAHPAVRAFGHAADLAALRTGAQHARWCFGSCWALMLLPLLVTTSHVLAMVPVTLWMWAERLDRPTRPSWRGRLPTRAARAVGFRARSMLPSV